VQPSTEPATIEDLVADAKSLGRPVKARLITDWVSLGLLDNPKRQPRGRGRGSDKALWPPEQRDLFRSLVERRGDVKRITVLANLPVFVWLEWGDDFVPLRQVRRALASWTGPTRKVPWKQARTNARELLGQIEDPRAKREDKAALVTLVAQTAYSGVPVDREQLIDAVAKVLDPDATAAQHGPPGARFSPDGYVELLEARLVARDRIADLPDSHFRWARNAYRVSTRDYESDQPRLRAEAGPRFAPLFERMTMEHRLNNACHSLLTLIGLGMLNPAGMR
jgi:hypothetical protein